MYKWIKIETNADYNALATSIDAEFDPVRVASRLEHRISQAVKAVLIEPNVPRSLQRSQWRAPAVALLQSCTTTGDTTRRGNVELAWEICTDR